MCVSNTESYSTMTGNVLSSLSQHVQKLRDAMLLPTVTYSTGNMVMERLENLYCQEIPANALPFNARIVPLGTAKG